MALFKKFKKRILFKLNIWMYNNIVIVATVCFSVVALAFAYIIFVIDIFHFFVDSTSQQTTLSFYGSFLCFVSTLLIGFASLFQTKEFTNLSYKRLDKERHDKIQPIFVLNIQNTIFENCENRRISSFIFKLKNLGEFPGLNICLFDEYIIDSISSNESVLIEFLCSDGTFFTDDNAVHVVLDDFIKQKITELPNIIKVDYLDIDGHNMVQKFVLGNFNEKKFYSLFLKESIFMDDNII